MNEAIYSWYVQIQRLLATAKQSKEHNEELLETISEWEDAITAMDIACPDVKSTYEQRRKMQQSFTPEQVDYICYTIGDWYLHWKSCIVIDGEKNQHRLGVAKEQLKTMICGD